MGFKCNKCSHVMNVNHTPDKCEKCGAGGFSNFDRCEHNDIDPTLKKQKKEELDNLHKET